MSRPFLFYAEWLSASLAVRVEFDRNLGIRIQNPAAWGYHFKAMIEIMGSEEALMEEIRSWSELVESQEVFYYKQIG